MRPVLVIGSSNTDMVVRVPQLPAPGETVLGGEFKVFHGGKGANQAVAARRAGAEVTFFGAIGNDTIGADSIASLRSEGIDTRHVLTIDDVASGVAQICVDDHGENSIAVAPGANARITANDIDRLSPVIENAGVVLMQLETPLEAIDAAARVAGKADIPVILNPAPASKLDDALLGSVAWLTPNAVEASMLAGIRISDDESALDAARVLVRRGAAHVVVTLGGEGVVYCDDDRHFHIPAPRVDVVDATAAGDTFNGVFAALLNEGAKIERAIEVAVRAASLSVQSHGAQDSIPLRSCYDVPGDSG